MKSEIQHTPTPWNVAKSVEGYQSIIETSEGLVGRIVTRDTLRDEANAEFIVRAVNSHEALLKAAKKARTFILAETDGYDNEALLNLEKAIAQAEEVKP